MDFSIYRNKRVLITGHTGFKGSWLAIWLHVLGAKVYGYSLPPPTKPALYTLANVRSILAGETIADIRDRKAMTAAVRAWKPDVVFHLAAQPIVRTSYQIPYETFETNVLGTASVLDAVRAMHRPCAVVCITTDKCYENRERPAGYKETDPFGGYDPYSASKGAAEILIASYRRSFFNPAELKIHGIQLASARAGNVIGGGDWAKDRIIPDLVRALSKGQPAPVRNPKAVRPWQHVLEPLSGYLTLGAKMLSSPSAKWCEGWNFGPARSGEDRVGHVADLVVRFWGSGKWVFTGKPGQPHEANLLRLNIVKAKKVLGWKPRWNLETAVFRTVLWYSIQKQLHTSAAVRKFCEIQIDEYFGKKF